MVGAFNAALYGASTVIAALAVALMLTSEPRRPCRQAGVAIAEAARCDIISAKYRGDDAIRYRFAMRAPLAMRMLTEACTLLPASIILMLSCAEIISVLQRSIACHRNFNTPIGDIGVFADCVKKASSRLRSSPGYRLTDAPSAIGRGDGELHYGRDERRSYLCRRGSAHASSRISRRVTTLSARPSKINAKRRYQRRLPR